MGDFQIWRRSVAHGGAPLGLLYAVAAVGKSPPSVPIVDVAVREEGLQIWRILVAHGGAPLGLLYAVAAVGKSPPSVPIVDVAVLGNLVLVSAINPGIIMRNEQDLTEDANTSYNFRVKKTRITINGVELKLKYCRICKNFRPPRSCHCIVCDNCVEKFDHHCPWIGQCIALRNYRFYLTFVVSAFAFFIYVFSFTCSKIRQRMTKSETNLFGLFKNCPETLALALFSLAATLSLGGLAMFHVHLIATNQTAYENFRQRFAGSKSPYDKGILGNIKEVLFKPMPPSRVDFRAEVASGDHHPTAANAHEV
ncbi:hypothetical protein TIFTF001_030827 [Ficus carica]|uniref:S-acyltransferase n=1 Tax=Ficus carica TaxID=3494 RepID=A0AA88DU21_FICCA|nr:hypothetical protein TIFTF001_030827 [Ficus carica]